MINAINTPAIQPKYGRRQFIHDSGYITAAAGTMCGITGMCRVKLPYKKNLHKYSAYLTALTTFLHIGAVKRWDKVVFQAKKMQNYNPQ